METSRGRLWDGVLGLVLVAAFPIAAFDLTRGLYAQAAMALAACLAGAFILGDAWVRRQAAVALGRVEMVYSVVAPARPMTLRVLSARGSCPLGFRPGQTWAVDARGHLAPALCRGATRQLEPMLQRAPEDGRETQAACRCPVLGRELTFGVQAAASAA
jgi:hypothetical protein